MTGGRASRRNANRLWQQYAWLTERDVLIVKATAGSRLSSSDLSAAEIVNLVA